MLWIGRNSSSSGGGGAVKTYRPILHEPEAGAKVSQADVAVHIQQNVVRLDVPEKRERERGQREERKERGGGKSN